VKALLKNNFVDIVDQTNHTYISAMKTYVFIKVKVYAI